MYGLHFMSTGLYRSCHTVNVSFKCPFYKTALKSNVAWNLKGKAEKEQHDARQAKTLMFTTQNLLVTVRCGEK